MRDVADRAGVGLATVSRVVNELGSVRPATADRVRAAIVELGFQRNEVARALRPGQHSQTIGLLLGDLTNPFYATLAKAAVGGRPARPATPSCSAPSTRTPRSSGRRSASWSAGGSPGS